MDFLSVRALLLMLVVLVAVGVAFMGIRLFWEPGKTQTEIAQESYDKAMRTYCDTIGSRLERNDSTSECWQRR